MKISCFEEKVKSETGQLLSSCLIFGQNLGLKAKQPSCLYKRCVHAILMRAMNLLRFNPATMFLLSIYSLSDSNTQKIQSFDPICKRFSEMKVGKVHILMYFVCINILSIYGKT